MLFSSYIVIRTTSSWMRSCPITRFDTKKADVKEWPSFESCSSPAPWGLLVFWILETVPHCDPRPKKLFTVISTCTLCQSDGREYSLYMRTWLTVFTMRWCLAGHTDDALVCSRSIVRDLLHQRYFPSDSRAEHSKPVQNAALRASEIRILPHKLRKRRSLPFCTTSGIRPPSVHVVARREWANFLLVC